MIRSDQIVLSAVLTVMLVLTAPSWRRRLAAVGIVALAFCIVLGPWVGRNFALTREAQPFGTSGRFPTAIGVHLPFDRDVGEFSTYRRSVRFGSDTRPDDFSAEEASVLDAELELRKNILRHTGEFAVTRVIGQAQLWVWPVTANVQYNLRDPVPYGPLMFLHLLILVLGLGGFFRFRRHLVIRLGISAFACVAALHLITFPQPRYALTVIPFLMVAMAPFLAQAIGGIRRVFARRTGSVRRDGDAAFT